MTIRAKLLSVLFGLFVSIVVIGAMGLYAASVARTGLASVFADRVVPLADLKFIADNYAVSVVDASHKIRAGTMTRDTGAAEMRKAVQTSDEKWQGYMLTFMDDEERRLAEEGAAKMEKAKAAVADLIAIVESQDDAALVAFIEKRLYLEIDPLSEAIAKLIDIQVREARAAYDGALSTGRQVNMGFMAVFALVLGLVVLGVYCVQVGVVRRLGRIAASMVGLAEGDLGTEIPFLKSTDEVGGMARAVEVFKTNAMERAHLQEQQQKSMQAREERQKKLDIIVAAFRGDVTELLNHVATDMRQLNEVALALGRIAEQSATQAVSASASSEQASGNVQTVAGAAEQLSASIGEISQKVTNTAGVVAQANETAQQANGRISGLDEAAQKIGDVVSLIRDIAEQTNLLALNATIEAARAGDSGKGFAVVASEVKTLATQTAKATEDIAQQVSEIQAATKGAVVAINSISSSIEEIDAHATMIAAAVEEQGAATAEISRNAQETAHGTQDVAVRVTQLSEGAQRTRDSASQATGTIASASSNTQKLSGLIDGFLADVAAA